MNKIRILERDMTDSEFAQMNEGFNSYELKHCSSGLAYKNEKKFNNWFQLTDLFVERNYRGKGLGKILIKKLEEKLISLGIHNIWTWTDGYGALGFYEKQGYEEFYEFEKYYITGHSRVGLVKYLKS
jgi:GNAT superfamily N-acetyltransferase